jgi:cytochrome c
LTPIRVSKRYPLVGVMLLGLATIPGLSNSLSVAPKSQDGGADPKRGEELFQKRCAACHSLDKEKEGPRLRGVFGRKAGTVATFNYSNALKSANVSWNTDSLNQWLADTDRFIPDNDMNMSFKNLKERVDIIAYLRQLSDQ